MRGRSVSQRTRAIICPRCQHLRTGTDARLPLSPESAMSAAQIAAFGQRALIRQRPFDASISDHVVPVVSSRPPRGIAPQTKWLRLPIVPIPGETCMPQDYEAVMCGLGRSEVEFGSDSNICLETGPQDR
jgi:rubredoxin